jgi:RNA exonuclease NGL2
MSEQQPSVDSKPQKPESKRSKKKHGGPKPPITPEYIAEQRAKREAGRKAKRDALIAQGIDPDQVDIPADLRFISRPLLEVPHSSDIQDFNGLKISIMTYNILAQALIRRKLFPTSGNALKWFKRSQVLLNEFKYYNSDIMLLQEVDYIQYNSFWKPELGKLGYDSAYTRWGEKNHGIAIFYKSNLFDVTDKMLIDYDKEVSGNIPPRTVTKNVGLILALKFKHQILQNYPNTTQRGLLVGTTHLFWHPFGTFERTRQSYLVLSKFKEFIERVSILQGGSWYKFFGGDFNSQPYDAPYLSLSSKPIRYTDRCKTVIECSSSYQFSKLREGIEDDDEEGGNIEKFGENQPKSPTPESFIPTEEQALLVKEMENLHNSLPMRATSLYSVAYKLVHPENAGLDNDKFEPEVSNWAHSWRGLLDYIFYIDEWDLQSKAVSSLQEFEESFELRIKKLLRLPASNEMCDHGQPHEGEYPSDHLCMIAEVELKM